MIEIEDLRQERCVAAPLQRAGGTDEQRTSFAAIISMWMKAASWRATRPRRFAGGRPGRRVRSAHRAASRDLEARARRTQRRLRRTVYLYGVAGRQRTPVASAVLKMLRAADWSRYTG